MAHIAHIYCHINTHIGSKTIDLEWSPCVYIYGTESKGFFLLILVFCRLLTRVVLYLLLICEKFLPSPPSVGQSALSGAA